MRSLPLFLLFVVSSVFAQDDRTTAPTTDYGASSQPEGEVPAPLAPDKRPPVFVAAHEGVLTLATALAKARANNPTLHVQMALEDATIARKDKALSSLLPNLTANAQYARTTSNLVQRPGYASGGGKSSSFTIVNADGTTSTAMTTPTAVNSGYSGTLFNQFSFGLQASVLLYDFNTTIDRYRSASETSRAYRDRTRASELTTDFNVRDAFLRARAQRALVVVSEQTVANNQRHVDQIQAFVDAGTRPQIDLLQVRTDLANARVALLQAQNTYAVAKVTLQRNMGVEEDVDFEIADEQVPPLAEEQKPLSELLGQAMSDRPDVSALVRDQRANQLLVGAAKGGYGPSLTGTGGITRQGIKLDNLATNWQVGAQASWQLYQGGYTKADVHEATANRNRAQASVAELRQTVRLQVAQAQIGLQTALAQLDATNEALENARGRLALAEGRYEAGVGNIIELGDAQIALTTAESQRIQAEYNISLARAQLISALGKTH
ncbi:MAG: outer rane efflux protein [Myxococcaceae bacterium]|nr:outer rane efflux protein [Myxococcaceae bacterium]